jgi:hypothetical protein
MAFLPRVALILGLMSTGSLAPVSSLAEEDDFYSFNEEAMQRHDAAMYRLVDDLSDCASYYSILMNSQKRAWSHSQVSEHKRRSFVALGVDALTTLEPGSRSERLLEMEARVLTSHNIFLNNFGSLGNMADAETDEMIESCEQLRLSKRRVFGWANLRRQNR